MDLSFEREPIHFHCRCVLSVLMLQLCTHICRDKLPGPEHPWSGAGPDRRGTLRSGPSPHPPESNRELLRGSGIILCGIRGHQREVVLRVLGQGRCVRVPQGSRALPAQHLQG